MPRTPTLADRIHHRAFGAVCGNALLYNACWEDPALDRQALNLGADDEVLVITSAGCNALDYALCGPRKVHAIDANPRQNALLELKLAGIRHLPFDEFFDLFGSGYAAHVGEMYHDVLRADLSPFAARYWDRRLHWFAARGWRRTFYFHGLSGLAARLMQSWVGRNHHLRDAVEALIAAPDLSAQREAYDRAAPLLWTRSLNWALSRRATLGLLGVPYAQMRELEASHPGGCPGFIRAAVESVLRDRPLADNYFWTVYLRGSYTRTCCPEYLKRENFYALKHGLADRVVAHTDTVTGFLRKHEQPISRFVLLDHLDWMGSWRPEALAEEWQAIFDRATPGARAIFRSASPAPEWIADTSVAGRPLAERLRFDRPLAAALHQRDRVGTYASFHIADLVPA